MCGGRGGRAATLAEASQGVCAAACSGGTATDGAVSPPPAAVRAPRSEQPSSCRLVLIAPALLLWGPIRSRPVSCLLRPLGARRWGSLSSISLFLLSVPPPSSPAVPSPLSPLPSLSVRCSVPGLAFARCACPAGASALSRHLRAGAAPPAVDPGSKVASISLVPHLTTRFSFVLCVDRSSAKYYRPPFVYPCMAVV